MLAAHKPYNNLPLLPPSNNDVETISILKQESKAAVALAELKGLARTLPNQNILINGIVLKEAKASSEIENIITTHDDLYDALTLKNAHIDKETKEVLRYREALLAGQRYIEQKGFLSTNGIIEIQKVLEQNNAGIRKLPGTALKNGLTGETIYTPPDDNNIIQNLMRNLESFINSDDVDLPVLVKLAIQHYQFESIHPFYDGNGRTGRIINILYLIMNKLLDNPILYLGGYIIKNKADYYRLLQEVRTKNNWEEWIIYMLKGIEQTSRETIEKINTINDLFEHTIRVAKEKSPKVYSKELIEHLFVHPYSKIEFLCADLNIDRKTATKYLKEMERLEILKSEPKGKEVIYINTKLYNTLKS